jgi:hypothetical protein
MFIISDVLVGGHLYEAAPYEITYECIFSSLRFPFGRYIHL